MSALSILQGIVLVALTAVFILACIFFCVYIVLSIKEYIKMVEEDEKKDG